MIPDTGDEDQHAVGCEIADTIVFNVHLEQTGCCGIDLNTKPVRFICRAAQRVSEANRVAQGDRYARDSCGLVLLGKPR
jgi:hypothetical protein